MSYTYGYIKQAALLNLQIDESEALTLGHVDRFSFAINEALSQIATTIKPNFKYVNTVVYSKEHRDFLERNGEDVTGSTLIGEAYGMPSDYLSFNNQQNFYLPLGSNIVECANDTNFMYMSNDLVFFKQGQYKIGYNAYWPMVTATTDDNYVLPWARDISECLPAYIAYKCFKLDSEEKAMLWYNQFEILYARISAPDYANSKTFVIEGNW